MMIYLVPQISTSSDQKITYKFKEDFLIIKKNDICESYDFKNVANGESYFTSDEIKSKLDYSPLLSAVKENGLLRLELLVFVNEEVVRHKEDLGGMTKEVTPKDKNVFSTWISSDEYVAPEGNKVNITESCQIIDMSRFWKTKEEIEEKEALQKQEQILETMAPSEKDRIDMLEEMIMMLMMER